MPKSASDLPPEAFDLASKLFDYAREGNTYLSAGIPKKLDEPRRRHPRNALLIIQPSFNNNYAPRRRRGSQRFKRQRPESARGSGVQGP
ncbi:hypothetical protein K432DRAFT_378799 [Lepidopterella palustris CBS 459.81]|uniref:Uncharacterized protein n=1 Tax=Lepidopterella palustris CBS 459.81 TaxID=1314670 RepID=A0A8E2EHR6_9PEZI|nr:hypothetical protein K432DRAFT_378799 [Lepidopterella palustris CBS 459.81]